MKTKTKKKKRREKKEKSLKQHINGKLSAFSGFSLLFFLFHAKVDEEMRGNHSEGVQLGKFGETESRVALCDRTFL